MKGRSVVAATLLALVLLLAEHSGHSTGQPIPPPRKDCTPGYHLCNVDTANMTVGHIGASTLHLLTSLKAHEDAEKVALGMGPAGNTGTDNAENFDPNLDLTKVGPRTGRKMLAASDVAAA
uniref:Uncharacterized protein n=1 Tax=Tetradesmus obliquus TaxID=3088 RepID=A0A383V4G6_TETOB|eukprot:jgi/Sobl393_1/5399/SZX59609.1